MQSSRPDPRLIAPFGAETVYAAVLRVERAARWLAARLGPKA